MGTAIGAILPFAVALALAPTPIGKMVLILLAGRVRPTGVAYLAGRALGLGVAVVIFLVLAGGIRSDALRTPSLPAAVIRLALGVLVLLAAVVLWYSWPKSGGAPKLPFRVPRIGASGPVRTFSTSLLSAVASPQHLPATIGAGLDIAQAGLPPVRSAVVILVLVLVGTSTVSVLLIAYVVGGPAAEHRLGLLRTWLVANDRTVLIVFCVLLGTVLIGKGVRGITA